MTHGASISMAAYGIGVLPMTKRLKAGFSDGTHTWYVDDAGALSMFSNFEYILIFKTIRPRLWVLPRTLQNNSDYAAG